MTKRTFNRRKANRDFIFKVRMERTFKRDLLKYFNKVKRYYKVGLPLPTIVPVLENHYNRIVRNMRYSWKKNQEDTDEIETAILIFLFGRPIRQASIIDSTTMKKIDQAKKNLIADGVLNPTRSDIANVMTRLNKARITNISVYETQQTFEGLKNTVIDTVHNQMEDAIIDQDEDRADELARIGGDWASYQVAGGIGKLSAGELFIILAAASKTWFHMQDSRVRPWHRAAGGQTVPFAQPFIVKGELLMFPGDSSLGASLDNTSGCRCVAA